MVSEADGSHVGPDGFDVGEAMSLDSRGSFFGPAVGKSLIGEPEGVLAFVVDDDLVEGRVF